MWSRMKNFLKSLVAERTLIKNLALNDMKAKYSSSVLGGLWIYILPLVTIFVFWYVFQMGFRNSPVDDVPYILWFTAAYVPWIYFSDMITMGANSLQEYSYLVKKVKFQVSILPLIKVLSAAMVHLGFVVFLIVMGYIYHYPVRIGHLQFFYYFLCETVLGLGLAWLFSALSVMFKDVIQIVNIIVQVGFWVTPILWNADQIQPGVRAILKWNPMYYIVQGYRNSFLFNKYYFWEKLPEAGIFWVITLLFLALGAVVFMKLRPFFADEL